MRFLNGWMQKQSQISSNWGMPNSPLRHIKWSLGTTVFHMKTTNFAYRILASGPKWKGDENMKVSKLEVWKGFLNLLAKMRGSLWPLSPSINIATLLVVPLRNRAPVWAVISYQNSSSGSLSSRTIVSV